jgi:hypothetical protein
MSDAKYDDHDIKTCPHTTCSNCDNKIAQLLPGGSWVAWYLEDDGSLSHIRLIGWGLERNGYKVEPLVWQDGFVQSADAENLITVSPLDEGEPDEILIDQAKTRTAVLHQQRADRLKEDNKVS